MKTRDEYVYFITGSQHLYGDAVLGQVDDNSRKIAETLDRELGVPVAIRWKPVATTPDTIHAYCREADADADCVGVIFWMHTFSPAKMWIHGLQSLTKPFLHLHTQFNRDIPWAEIDMDFMNLNQSAHGGREFGHICSRLGKTRKVVAGHWQDDRVRGLVAQWIRTVRGWHEWQCLTVARIGDNMRDVAVTEGDKVEAHQRLGFRVSGYGVGDLVECLSGISASDTDTLVEEYKTTYTMENGGDTDAAGGEALREAARIELGLRAFLDEVGAKAFTTTFENLHGLHQLPGLAVQRLMARGYGFGAEGDWKTAALVRCLKVMSEGLSGGTSFMEDYTYHLEPGNMKVLGAHMLEVCPTTAASAPRLAVHPLSIGGKEPPARLIFDAREGEAINASLIDIGPRFRMILNELDVVSPDQDLPKLPVARALWKARPDLATAAEAWIQAGAAHHSAFSQAVDKNYIRDLCRIADIELIEIGEGTTVHEVLKELRINSVYYHAGTLR